MKFYITGSTRGLGEYLCREFNCINFDHPYDIANDIDSITEQIESDSIVILNAHANGTQIEYVKKLKDRCKLIICGSIVSVKPDKILLDYSKEKNILEKYVTDVSLYNLNPILYLRLTSSSYKDYNLISNTIRFWLDNPNFVFAGYNVND